MPIYWTMPKPGYRVVFRNADPWALRVVKCYTVGGIIHAIEMWGQVYQTVRIQVL